MQQKMQIRFALQLGLVTDCNISLTKLISGNSGFGCFKRVRFAYSVNGLDSEEVLFAMNEPDNLVVERGGHACIRPRATGHIHLLDDVMENGGATVIYRHPPG